MSVLVSILALVEGVGLREESCSMDDLRFRKSFNLGITKDISRKKLSKLEKLQSLVA